MSVWKGKCLEYTVIHNKWIVQELIKDEGSWFDLKIFDDAESAIDYGRDKVSVWGDMNDYRVVERKEVVVWKS